MDLQSLEQVMKEIQTRTRFNVIDFGQRFVPFPAPFSDVGRLNEFSTKPGVVLLEQLMKQPKKKCKGVKRKLADSPGSLAILPDPVKGTDSFDRFDYEIDFSGDMVKNALERLNNFLQRDNMEKLQGVFIKSKDEGDLEIGLGIHLISKLAWRACTSSTKRARSCPCGCSQHLEQNEKMWIGSENTWYGELDMIAWDQVSGGAVSLAMKTQTSAVVRENEVYDVTENGDNEINDSPDNSTNDEVKCEIQRFLNQVVAQAVVFGFTEYNRPANLGHFIPSILFLKTGYYITIYNPVADVCLLSNFIVCGGLDSGSKVAYVLLWIILNHRIFFRNSTKDVTAQMASHFQEKVNGLQNFQMLSGYSKRISEKWDINLQEEWNSLASPDTYAWAETL